MKRRFARHYHTLKTTDNHWLRKSVGLFLTIGGILGPFTPVLGVWMLPLGVALLAVDWPVARRGYRRSIVWWGRRLEQLRLRTASRARRRKNGGSRDTRSDPSPP